MKIALHDSDATSYPNLALMKISTYHKNKGNDVEWFNPDVTYDKVYSSKVFTFTAEDTRLPEHTIKGGTGYNTLATLPDYVEHLCPDYSLYDLQYSLGFVTRGCPRKCAECFVPSKEGNISAHADLDEFVKHRDVVLMDNNILALEHGIHMIEKAVSQNLRLDFNQGLDARLIDDSIARLLSKLKFLKPLRLACDSLGMMSHVEKAVGLLRYHNVTPSKYFCYVLVKDIPDALERIKLLKKLYIDPFAQPYRDKNNTPTTKEQRAFARWVNAKQAFTSCTWEEYKEQMLKDKKDDPAS